MHFFFSSKVLSKLLFLSQGFSLVLVQHKEKDFLVAFGGSKKEPSNQVQDWNVIFSMASFLLLMLAGDCSQFCETSNFALCFITG